MKLPSGMTCDRLGQQHSGECIFPQCNCRRPATPEQIAQHKRVLETGILAMVKQFEQQTGETIRGIQAEHECGTDGVSRIVQIQVWHVVDEVTKK